MYVQKYFLLWFITISLLSRSLQYKSDHFSYSTFADVALALHGEVKFMSERIEQVNADAVFGLTLAQVNLGAALSSPRTKFLFELERGRLVETEKLCDGSRISAKNKLFRQRNSPIITLMQVLTNPEIWMERISWREKTLPVPSPSPDLTVAEATALIFSGTPQESESENCLTQLVNNDCRISNACADMLTRDDGSRGYPLTHRLLYIKIARALNCEKSLVVNSSILIDKYCQEILQDLIDLETTNFPTISRDLAMEQIVLCGMEGYSEFTDEHYADLITSWQSPHGCYSGFNVNQGKSGVRRKRSTNPMDYGCDSHASGVAAATLSLLIRRYVESHLSRAHKVNHYN